MTHLTHPTQRQRPPRQAVPSATSPNADTATARMREYIAVWPTLVDAATPEDRALAHGFTLETLALDVEAMAASILMSTLPDEHEFPDLTLLVDQFLHLATRVEANDPRRFVTIAAGIIHARLVRGEYTKAIAASTAALAVVSSYSADDLASAANVLPWLWLCTGRALAREGDIRAAVPHFLRIASTGEASWVAFVALSCLSFALSHGGQFNQSFAFAEKALAIGEPRNWVVSEHGAPLLVGLCLIYGCRLEIAAFGESLEALAAANPQDPMLIAVDVMLRAEYLRMTGNTAAGLEALGSADGPDEARIGVYTAAVLRRERATLLIAGGNPGAALREVADLPMSNGHIVCWDSIRGLAYLALGQPHLALAATESCVAQAENHSLRNLPEVLAVRAAANIALERTDTAVLIFSEACAMAANSGCNGMSLIPKSQLAALITAATSAGVPVPPAVLEDVTQPTNVLDTILSTVGSLTRSERTLLWELRGDETLDEIATRTFTARNTVKAHTHNILVKLGAGSRREAVRIAQDCGFFDVPTIGAP